MFYEDLSFEEGLKQFYSLLSVTPKRPFLPARS